MIKVEFKTNLDHPRSYSWQFPKEVCCKPEIGDLVEAKDGTLLKVCSITHSERTENQSNLDYVRHDEIVIPYLIVELTKRGIPH